MAVTLSQKVKTLLLDLGEDRAKFTQDVEALVKLSPPKYFKRKLNKVDYYFGLRKVAANYEAYDYGFDKEPFL